MQTEFEQQSKKKLALTILAVVGVAGVVLAADHMKSEAGASTSSTSGTPVIAQTAPTNTSPSTPAAATTSTSSLYKDGTYTASSQYYVPDGYEEIKVTLTLKNGTIADSSVTNSESNHDSARFQRNFSSIYKTYVIGRNVASFKLGAVAGASDTSAGFNDALTQIVQKAQA